MASLVNGVKPPPLAVAARPTKHAPPPTSNRVFSASGACLRVHSTSVAVIARSAIPGGGRAGGAGVLERPGFDRTNDTSSAPSTEAGGERANVKRVLGTGGGNQYRVLLLDHERHTEDQVARVLPTAVPLVTPDNARKIFQESRELGAGLVTLALKEHAEFHAQRMAMYGLRSTIQPDGPIL